MNITLINPNLVVQRNDPFTTGIVYMPVSLAYAASSLRTHGASVTVIDAFAEKPKQVCHEGAFSFYGLTGEEIIQRIPDPCQALFVYAINLTNHLATLNAIRQVKNAYPQIPVVVLENTQAVTAYSLRRVAEEFYAAGADFVLSGEADRRILSLVDGLAGKAPRENLRNIDGLGTRQFYNPPLGQIEDLDALPFPAWDLFPLSNYWTLRHSHGPFETGRYLPLLTSRGCPYPCKFCVVPETNARKWRARSAQNVVDEIELHSQKFGVREFHVEDLDPTISDKRTREICREILKRDLKITWKLAAGTKVESIQNEETIDLMAQAGCRYISISPETGSERLLKLMDKPFDLEHAVRIVKRMNETGIRSQACFVLGFPGETGEDRALTWNLAHDLTKVGVDEIALFIITPVPGSAIYPELTGYQNLSQLNFSPTWRPDYPELARFRLKLYRQFLLWKLRYHPKKILRQPFNFIQRRFETKMEMAPYRALKSTLLGLHPTTHHA